MIKFDSGMLALSPCCAVAYDMQTEMSSSPTGVVCLPAGKHKGILTDFQTKDKEKMAKIVLFLDGDLCCKQHGKELGIV